MHTGKARTARQRLFVEQAYLIVPRFVSRSVRAFCWRQQQTDVLRDSLRSMLQHGLTRQLGGCGATARAMLTNFSCRLGKPS